MFWYNRLAMFCVLFALYACQKETIVNDKVFQLEIPSHFPPMEEPVGNEFTYTRWKLGKSLFYDTRFSSDGRISCGTCHKPNFAFSDDQRVSFGANHTPGRSNAPPLFNLGYHPYLTRAGGVPTLEMQVLVPIQEHDEFNSNIVQIAKDLSSDQDLQSLSQEAYGRPLDPYVITRALSNFERTLISGASPYDKFILGNPKALSRLEKLGMNLFNSERFGCNKCHSGIFFTDFSFQNNGLYKDYKDEGRKVLTNRVEDEALFKVPSLRNISMTAPYMHNGEFLNLDDVIEHYSKGGTGHRNQSPFVKSIHMSGAEKRALKAFLLTLTDESFIRNKYFVKDE